MHVFILLGQRGILVAPRRTSNIENSLDFANSFRFAETEMSTLDLLCGIGCTYDSCIPVVVVQEMCPYRLRSLEAVFIRHFWPKLNSPCVRRELKKLGVATQPFLQLNTNIGAPGKQAHRNRRHRLAPMHMDLWLSCCKYKSLFSTENFRIFMMRKFRLSVLGKLYKSWERIFLVAIRATELFCSGQGAMAEAPNLEGILAPLLLRVARLEAHVTTMDLPFVEDRLDNMETVVAALGREFDALAQRLEELQRQIRRLEAAVRSLERERRSINDLADRISNLEIASGQETQRALEYHQIVLQELDHRVASLESPAHPDNP